MNKGWLYLIPFLLMRAWYVYDSCQTEGGRRKPIGELLLLATVLATVSGLYGIGLLMGGLL